MLGLNYSPEPTGIAPYTASLAEYLASTDRNVVAVTGFPHYPRWKRNPDMPGFRRRTRESDVDLRRLTHWIPNPPRGLKRLVSEITFGLHQVTVGWARPDVAILVSPALASSAMCMGRALLTPRTARIVWVQDLYSQGMAETGEGGATAVRAAKLIEGWLLRRAHAVIAIHPSMAERIADDLGVERDRVHVVGNWSHITLDPVDVDAVRAQHGWAPDDFVVLHAGNMGRKQGLSNVVDAAKLAAAQGSHVKFVMLGDGADRPALEEAADGCTHLTFIDPLPDADFTAALQAADALLVNELPGVREMAVPSKLTSYFAARRPVIAAAEPTGIVSSIMNTAGAGPVVPSGHPDQLLTAAEQLAGDPETARTAADAGHAYFSQHLSQDAAMRAFEDVLATLDER